TTARTCMLVAGQQKLYVATALSLANVKEEARKTEAAVQMLQQAVCAEAEEKNQQHEGEADEKRSSLQVPTVDHMLVIYATRVTEELFNRAPLVDFPKNCLLLTGNALRQYFGTVLSDRLFV